MKKYDLIVGIGCSFMEGGGLDNPDIHKALNGLDEIASIDDRERFKYKNNFIAYLAEKLNCGYVNLAESQSSNDLIFKKIYDYFRFINQATTDTNILFIGQLSMFTRQYVYYDYIKKFVKLNRGEFSDPPFFGSPEFKPLFDYYKNYLSFLYNENNVISNLEKDMELYTVWLKNKKVDCLWLSYDGAPNQFVESENFIKFDGDNLGAWVSINKLRLCDIDTLKTGDLHMSIEAHKIVAEKIYNKII
jgi:hypothetical protein